MDSPGVLDWLSWQLLEHLQTDARLSYAELGRRVGLSPPAVVERVRRLEEAGIITGYHARLNPLKLGYTLTAMIELTTTPLQYSAALACMESLPEVRTCHHVTGQGSFRIEVIATSMAHLEQIIQQLSAFGSTTTSVVLSSPIQKQRLSSGCNPPVVTTGLISMD